MTRIDVFLLARWNLGPIGPNFQRNPPQRGSDQSDSEGLGRARIGRLDITEADRSTIARSEKATANKIIFQKAFLLPYICIEYSTARYHNISCVVSASGVRFSRSVPHSEWNVKARARGVFRCGLPAFGSSGVHPVRGSAYGGHGDALPTRLQFVFKFKM